MILNDMAWFWSHRLPLAQGIQDQGWKLGIAAPRAKSDKKLEEAGFKAFNLPDSDNAKDIFAHIRTLKHIYKLIQKTKPDIVHAITIRYALYTGLVTRFTNQHSVILTIAGLGSLFTDKGFKATLIRTLVKPLLFFAFYRRDIFIIFQNPDDQKQMLDAGLVRSKNTNVIRGSGVDLDQFPYTAEPETETPVILFSSRLIKEKGIYDFVEASCILKENNIQARFQVAGDFYPKNPHSVPRQDMNQWLEDGTIEWLGQCSNMAEIIQSSAIVVLPSYYREGVPKILLEAAATGRPIITTNLPGCREVVEHNVNGLLIEAQNPQQLADAIVLLLNDKDKRIKFGKAGHEKASSEFDVVSVVRRTLDVYDRMMEV